MWVVGRRPSPPPSPEGASGQQLVVKGTVLWSPWALRALNTSSKMAEVMQPFLISLHIGN